jgi:hypothetical protein
VNARTIDELGAMAAARRQLEMLTADQRAEVLREYPKVDELVGALERIAELDPEQTAEGFNEWGESECFLQARKIAAGTIASWRDQ